MPSHTLTYKWTGATTFSKDVAETATSETLMEETVVTASTDYLINIAIDVSEVDSFYLNSTQAVTLETNNGTTPDNTISLVADQPYMWHSGDYVAFLLTVDVTKFYITNNSGATATITVKVLQDATP